MVSDGPLPGHRHSGTGQAPLTQLCSLPGLPPGRIRRGERPARRRLCGAAPTFGGRPGGGPRRRRPLRGGRQQQLGDRRIEDPERQAAAGQRSPYRLCRCLLLVRSAPAQPLPQCGRHRVRGGSGRDDRPQPTGGLGHYQQHLLPAGSLSGEDRSRPSRLFPP